MGSRQAPSTQVPYYPYPDVATVASEQYLPQAYPMPTQKTSDNPSTNSTSTTEWVSTKKSIEAKKQL